MRLDTCARRFYKSVMTGRVLAGLAVSAVLLTLVAGCPETPTASRQVNRAVLGELFVISE